MSRVFLRLSTILIVINLTMTLALPGPTINEDRGDDDDDELDQKNRTEEVGTVQNEQNLAMRGVNTTTEDPNGTATSRMTIPVPGNIKQPDTKPCGSGGPCEIDRTCKNTCRRRCVDDMTGKAKGKKSCGGILGKCPVGQTCKKKCGDQCVKTIDCINRPCGHGLPPCCNYRECAYGFNKTFHPVQHCWYSPAGA